MLKVIAGTLFTIMLPSLAFAQTTGPNMTNYNNTTYAENWSSQQCSDAYAAIVNQLAFLKTGPAKSGNAAQQKINNANFATVQSMVMDPRVVPAQEARYVTNCMQYLPPDMQKNFPNLTIQQGGFLLYPPAPAN